MAEACSTSVNPLHVIIVGGGIGGLCLAQGLKRAGISFAVYERDRTPDSRLQGYRLNIEPVGAEALNECLPEALWRRLVESAGDASETMGVFDEHLTELMREDPRPPAATAVEATHAVSRTELRRCLLQGLDAEVCFDKEFLRYELRADGKVCAFFSDGSSAAGDLLVGADGSNSRVRRQLLPGAPEIDTRGVGIGGKLPLTPENHSWIPAPLLRGKSMLLPKKDFLFTAVYRPRARALPAERACEPDYIMWAFVAHRETLPEGALALRGGALRKLVDSRMQDWHPLLRRVVKESADDSLELFQFRAAGRVRPWDTRSVTLLGDAIHAMPPVGGVGGNVALRDASLLCRTLRGPAAGSVALSDAVRDYESEMLRYGFAAVRQTRLYLFLAIVRSRLVRQVARLFFKLCGALPGLRSAIFSGPRSIQGARE